MWGATAARQMAQSEYIHFADCEIDVAGFSLRRAGAVCALEPQVLELLLFLARNPDRLLTKDDLIQHVWHGRIVSDTTKHNIVPTVTIQRIVPTPTKNPVISTTSNNIIIAITAIKIIITCITYNGFSCVATN